MKSKDTTEKRAKCVTAYYFLDKYNELEAYVKDLFKDSVVKAPDEVKNKIFFLAGGGLVSTYICAGKVQIEMNPIKYKGEESLWKFNLTQIINLNNEFNIIPILNEELELIQRNFNVVTVKECIKIFGSMRNKLVHNTENAIFKETDLVEKLSVKNIEKYQTEHDFDDLMASMDDSSQELASNIIYMDKVMKILTES